ncbi:MAG TPA: hypothetical protein VMN60_10615 [Longimicrobiales bacterium]|nr:hypothetical protein [Longimicrobiales bacterium]
MLTTTGTIGPAGSRRTTAREAYECANARFVRLVLRLERELGLP